MIATIEIKSEQKHFFEELANLLGAKITFEDAKKEEFLNKLERSYKQAQMHREGKITLKTFDQLLDEL